MSAMKIGGVPFDQDQVLEIVVGYAFGDERLVLRPPIGRDFGTLPSPRVNRFAYRSYDCVPRSPDELDARDILVVAGLNTGIDAAGCLAALAVAPSVTDALAHVPAGTRFWDLPRDEIGADVPVNSVGWYVQRAWWLLRSAPGIGNSISHKILHHKHPAVFPLLDWSTIELLPEGRAWQQIHQDLNEFAEEFESIEWMFGRTADDHRGVRLTRLRIHDIVLWCHATRQTDIATELGRPLLERAPV
ncbi:MAG TPA: DUF6308 family protein [Acidimicrobiia bacterium]|nr:DUF6308 family protein [Acidimicrobiia bacterium]